MSIMAKFDKTSPVHRLVHQVRKDWHLRGRWKNDFAALAREYGLSEEEARALENCDLVKLQELGVHPFYFNPIIRMKYGEDWDEYQETLVGIMKRAYGLAGDPRTYEKASSKPE